MCSLLFSSSINDLPSKIINQNKNNNEITSDIAPSQVWSNTSRAMAIEGIHPKIIANRQYNKLSYKLFFLKTYKNTIWVIKHAIISPGKMYSKKIDFKPSSKILNTRLVSIALRIVIINILYDICLLLLNITLKPV